MTPTQQTICNWLVEAIDEIRTTSPALGWPPPDEHTIVIGAGSLLDSLDFSSVMAAVEGKVAEQTGRDYVFDIEQEISLGHSRAIDVDGLAQVILRRLDGETA